MLGIGIAFDPMLDRGNTFGRAIALFAFRSRAVNLDQHRIVDIAAEGAFDRF